MDFTQLAPADQITKTIESLSKNGMSAEVVATAEEAKNRVVALIPHGAEVMDMTSITLASAGIAEVINTSGNYNSVRNKLNQLNRNTDSLLMQKLGAAPEWAVGSVHAVTQEGQVLIASNSGSQLPGYVYGSAHVIWVVGTQKIVSSVDEGMRRIQEYVLPLESERARKAYGLPETWQSFVSKLLILYREPAPKRIHIIFVNEALGF